MKEIIMTEEQFSDRAAIMQKLLDDENDPRSLSYKRVLKRPEINWAGIIFYIITAAAAFFCIYSTAAELTEKKLYALLITSAAAIVFLLIKAEKILICLVHIYQRYAPDSVRNNCRFEPSCSEYMILSLEKYGLIKGLKKGINRLKRCNIKNGGFDFP